MGVVERIDESLVIAEEELRQYFDKIDLSYIKQNISPERNGNLDERLVQGRSDIGNTLMDDLIQKNKLDSLLHEFAHEELGFIFYKKKLLFFLNKFIHFRIKFR